MACPTSLSSAAHILCRPLEEPSNPGEGTKEYLPKVLQCLIKSLQLLSLLLRCSALHTMVREVRARVMATLRRRASERNPMPPPPPPLPLLPPPPAPPPPCCCCCAPPPPRACSSRSTQ